MLITLLDKTAEQEVQGSILLHVQQLIKA